MHQLPCIRDTSQGTTTVLHRPVWREIFPEPGERGRHCNVRFWAEPSVNLEFVACTIQHDLDYSHPRAAFARLNYNHLG